MSPEQYAERRDGLITAEVARRSLSARQVQRRKREGIWRAERRGVLAVNGAPRTWEQQVRAVVMSAGPAVVAAHVTAVRLFGADVPDEHHGSIHVEGDLRRLVRMDGVVHHRSGTLVDSDRTTRRGIPCTSAVRTVLDVSGAFTVEQLGALVDDLIRRKLLRLERLRERVASTRPAPGRSVARLKAVLAARIPGYDPGESSLESRLALLIAAGRIAAPAQQFKVTFGASRYRLDFAWPDRKIYLEGNGFGSHSIAADLDRDARRQNHLVIDGWRPIELTWRMTDDEIVRTLTHFGLADAV